MKKLKIVKIVKKEIVKNNNKIVYDITVKNDSSFTANNKIVHNSACTTYPTTGFGSRNIQASIINMCSSVTKKHIIADGGIQEPADITKSIVLGASMVMIGGMLSSFTDSPGKIVEKDDKLYKEFYGSASSKQSNKTKRIEGTVKLNRLKNTTLIEYLDYLTECLQSSISYGGGVKLTDLSAVQWI